MDSFSILKRSLKTKGLSIELLQNLSIQDIDSKKFLDDFEYFFIIISNNFSLEVDITSYFQVLEDIQKSGKRYWSVCDQRTIYARTMLRDLKLLSSYLDCLPYSVPDVIYLIAIYHVMTKEHHLDPETRIGNWVHPYRITEELTEYFFTQVTYLNG
ncbi:hypothetical protein RFH07_19640 [Acinetobacter seifertii]|uniref:hypothetical protein n=1 Tax=Acinetobacter seifertii TaxID=1530123 RepID=UPI00280D83F8|nr:hypothetical protein [Acinetobacter seifertii]MDQ9038767.1 hypothetical protein [Acinetobacter seifertii]